MVDVLKIFTETPKYEFKIEILLPNDEKEVDGGRVFRVCLSEFWDSFYDKCTNGTMMKVPILSHDFQEKEWIAAGATVICVGWKKQKYFPIKLSRCLMELCWFR